MTITIRSRRSIPVLSIFLLIVLSVTSCTTQRKDGLIAHWKFDEGAGDRLVDSSGHGNHGTIHRATWVTGRVGGGLRFDGVDDYVKVPKSASLNSISKEITLMCWIKTPLTGRRHTVLERWPCDDSNQRCLELDVVSEGKCVNFALSPNGADGTWHKYPQAVTPDKWVHIAATSDGPAMRIYVNGEPDPSLSVLDNPKIHPSTADLYIGAWNLSGNECECFFKGIIDEISIYSRSLTHEEILKSYKAGSPVGTVSGRITDENGKPIKGAKVSAGPFVVTADSQGRYRIAVPAKTYDVKVAGKGYRIGTMPDINVKEDQTAKADIALVKDTTPPVISELKVEDIDGVGATVLWKTNEACSSILKYGTSSRKYDKTLESPSRAKTHRLTLTGLASGTKCYFTVESMDEAQNAAISKERTFSTLKVDHPRLIFRKSDITALRNRAARTPWKEMKVDAIAYIKSHTYKYDPPDVSVKRYMNERYRLMAGITSAGALAYIVDPENKTYYKDKIVKALSDWDKLFVTARDWRGFNGQYWLNYDWCSAYAHSVLALDVICEDLSASRRADLEAKLGRVADWYHRSRSGYAYSAYGYWALYKNDHRRIDSAKTGWWQSVMDTMTPCGVYDIGPGYAHAGVSGRPVKWDFQHLLVSAGQKTEFYSNPTLVGFYEWLYGASISPVRRSITFGDSNPSGVQGPGITTYCTSRFSKKAGGNAAWFINGQVPPGRLMFYVLADWPPPKPKKPLSHIWPDGCAAFWEDNPSDKSLMGALWNNIRGHNKGHAHHETNALHLCAYGENVLRNTGYCYFHKPYAHGSKGPPTVLGNVVLIDGKEHAFKTGGGITESFTAPRFDYASGYSKDALPNGKHQRNFCFVHPQDGRCGYWVVFDEVDADKSSSKINVALHPRSDECTTVSDKAEYKWKIGPKGYTFSKHDVFLTIFLGTTPSSLSIENGLFWAGGPTRPWVGKYLYGTYDTDEKGKRNIVTVIFPHDAKHPKAKMTRVAGEDYTGAKVDLGNSVTDVAIESSGKKAVTCDRVTFKGLATLYRLKGDKDAFYFVRKGKFFNDGAKPRRGFESDKDVSVYVKGKQGRIISSGAEVTFYYPGITGVLLNGKAAPVIGSGNGWVKVAVAQGNHNISFTNKQD